MSLTKEELKKKLDELEELEPSEKKRKYKGYKKGFTRKYTGFK